jgi:hypothetical protein
MRIKFLALNRSKELGDFLKKFLRPEYLI